MLCYFWHYSSSVLEGKLFEYLFQRGDQSLSNVFIGFISPPFSTLLPVKCRLLLLPALFFFLQGFVVLTGDASVSHSQHALCFCCLPFLASCSNSGASASLLSSLPCRRGSWWFAALLLCTGDKHQLRHKLQSSDVSLKLTWFQIKSFADIISQTLSGIGLWKTQDVLPCATVPLSAVLPATSSSCDGFFPFSGLYWNVLGFLHAIFKIISLWLVVFSTWHSNCSFKEIFLF